MCIVKLWIDSQFQQGSIIQLGKTRAIRAVGRLTAYRYSATLSSGWKACSAMTNTEIEHRCRGRNDHSHCPVGIVTRYLSASSARTSSATRMRIVRLDSAPPLA